jgi:type I restriction enzyme S subunit
MSKWKECKIGELGRVITGTTPASKYPEQFGNEMPFVTPSDYKNYNKWIAFAERSLSEKGIEKLRSRILPANSILVTCIGSDMGKVAINKVPVISNQQINSIIVNENIDANFLYYKLVESYDTLRKYGEAGTAVPIVNKGDFENIAIEIPTDKNEQIAIAEILSSLDDKIDLLHRQNKTLEQLAETLFRKWFVEGAEESWEVGVLDDEFEFVMGQSPAGSTLNEEKQGMIFFQGRSDFGFRFPEPRVYTTEPTRIAKPLDTLVSVRAPVGDMNMALEECCLGRGVAAFRYKANKNFYSYTYYKMRSLMEPIKQFEDNGSVFGSIGKEDFKKLENVLPPRELIEKFQEIAKPIDDKLISNATQIRTLTQLRDALLPKLMSGEIRIDLEDSELTKLVKGKKANVRQ